MSRTASARKHQATNAASEPDHLYPLHPVGAVAATIVRRMRKPDEVPILYVARDGRRAREIVEFLQRLTAPERVALFPRWDGFAGDGLPASVPAVGARMSVLRWLLNADKRPAVVVSTAAALMRKVPPRTIWRDVHLEFRTGDRIDVEAVRRRLSAIGYVLDERCDEPGEAAIHGQVVEFYPAAAPRPCRIEHENGTVRAIRSFDPVSQRSVATSEHLIVDPASELVGIRDGDATDVSIESHYGSCATFFDYLPDAKIVIESEADRSLDGFIQSVDDSGKDFIDEEEWRSSVETHLSAVVDDEPADMRDSKVPVFAGESDPLAALERFLAPLREEGYRIVFTGPAGDTARLWSRRIARHFEDAPRKVDSWDGAIDAEPGEFLQFEAAIGHGFLAHDDGLVVVSLRELAGQSAVVAPEATPAVFGGGEELFGIGDAVVHFEHGVAVLEGLESVGDAPGDGEALRLRFADEATLLVPLSEIGAIWRYGGSATDVSLDRLRGGSWIPKRNRIVGEIAATADRMVEHLKEKHRAKAKPIRPDRVAFERFCSRFPYEPTIGQVQAVEAVLGDLKSGRPMDRLLCGDVGYGKTEVAVRAIAAAALSGRQVALVAPTTVLARQHFELLTKRFEREGIEVALLSRLQSAAEAKVVKKRLADGAVRVLVATHAVCGKDVAFDDLALLVIDEEQRFGSRHKNAMRKLGPNLHVLSMTATPIPRTLQAGFVGLHDLSVIATPPVRRRPIRTVVMPFDDDEVRDALLAERDRGGRSFVVCPRIEDIEPMAARLARLVPDLAVSALHGEMPAADVDRTMIGFAAGDGDVLLATNIIESGVDVTGANTMIVYRPDRFGLAQLHQLRGRVGRGARRGTAILAVDPDTELTEAGKTRLATLQRLTALGSGFDIAAQDLDLRGAGELLGDEQAGHLQLVGLSLYRRMLERALRAARGEQTDADWRCDLNVGFSGAIPADHVPEPELRIELAVSLDRVSDEAALQPLRADVTDRFGPMPPALETAFRLAALRLRSTGLGVRRLDAGPKAVAATFSRNDADRLKTRIKPKKGSALRWSDLRLILDRSSENDDGRWQAIEMLLDELG